MILIFQNYNLLSLGGKGGISSDTGQSPFIVTCQQCLNHFYMGRDAGYVCLLSPVYAIGTWEKRNVAILDTWSYYLSAVFISSVHLL